MGAFPLFLRLASFKINLRNGRLGGFVELTHHEERAGED
ncbi:hypothetical protein OP10G_1000 [Fimbriimonas ginsengisoli Gsoil 348]|uniref:Uncharacterized protein n=1 Tax=Fimbriimonas ginsengisoli Gsoil 348 TaxID=661478 RepID=A0A068NLB6_FIMGI|nr:hypothetical protein OP10G_1000 [Fimbriimonas ginsengisoli Gsoil 348]